MSIHKYSIIALLLCLICFCTACSVEEGCTDPQARNYNPEADRYCCCEYYNLRLKINHSADTSSFAYLTSYADAQGNTYEVRSVSILVSQIQLMDSLGQYFGISDSINIPLITGGVIWLPDDFSIIRPGTFINEIGSFIHLGAYRKIRFLVGLDETASKARAADIVNTQQVLSAGHSAGHYNSSSNTYRFLRWEISRPVSTDPFRYDLSDTVWIELDYPIGVVDGIDTEIPIRVDYSRFFQGVSFADDDSLTIVQKIKNNTRDAFSID